MALPKSFDYQYNCLQLPPAPLTPRAARSTRRRCLFKRKSDDQQMYAFDLLATVAGKLLSDGEICPPSTSKEEQPPFLVDLKKEKDEENNKPSEEKTCERNFIITELVSEVPDPNPASNEIMCAQNDPVSGITTCDGIEKVVNGNGSAEQLVNDDCKLRLGIFNPEPSGFRQDDSRKHVKTDTANNTRNLSIGNSSIYNNSKGSSGHPDNQYRKSSSLACSVVNNVKFPFSRDHTPCGSFPVRENVKLVSSRDDDDENSYECTELNSTRNKVVKLPPPPPNRRFRRLVPGSFHSKTTSNTKEDERNNNSESGNYPSRKNSLQGQRSLRDYPFKKRKLFDCGSSSNSDEGGASSDGVPENGISRDRLGSGISRNGLGSGSGSAPTMTQTPNVPGGYVSYHSRNPPDPVKLKIKSFKVPELIIEIPETATVGSLKKTVMEAVNSVLGGGLRVGVLLQGKKIRDDSKTLAQAGISHDNKMDSLGFTLEPSSSPPAPPIRLYQEDRQSQMLCQSPQPLARYPPTSRANQTSGQHQRHLDPSRDLPGSSFNNFMENDHDQDLNMSSLQRQTSESKALVPLSSAKQDALAVVPLRKSKRSESAQRRIRRPFTVAEVEALVQAVEKLGTGRWRDVKLRAFDSAKHRTYVDLKDKWKTLVHTARISPQQRRGEPVPQELLDRVLTAHAYWSQQQAKQQLKSQPDTCLLL